MFDLMIRHATPNSEAAVGLSANQKIDVCRGLFAFLVVSAHAVDISLAMHPEAMAHAPWWYFNLMHHVAGTGIFWVIGFFVISGYCIQLSVSRSVAANVFRLSDYVAARLSRILPLYYLGLATAVVVERLIAAARPWYWSDGINRRVLLSQIFLLQSPGETYGSYGPSWSIHNEMFYYLIYGSLICLTLRSRIRATTLGIVICIVVGFAMALVHFGLNRPPHVLRIGLLFGLGTIWFLGALIAENRHLLVPSRFARVVSAGWPVVLLFSIAIWFFQWVHTQILYMALATAFSLMLIHFVTVDGAITRRTHVGWRASIIGILGQASYPTYLFHGPLMILVASVIPQSSAWGDWRVTWAILVSVGVSSGVALGVLAERPILRWRKSFLRQFESKRTAGVESAANVRIAGIQD